MSPRPFGLLDRYVARQLVRIFLATLGGVVLLYLAVDFADRAHGFSGRAWGRAVLELYWNKAAVVAYQLAPAALIIAAALFASLLARRGELTALYALGVTPRRLAAPVGAVGLVFGVVLFFLGEQVVVRADARAEEIQVQRFQRWGDWASYHSGTSWLRGQTEERASPATGVGGTPEHSAEERASPATGVGGKPEQSAEERASPASPVAQARRPEQTVTRMYHLGPQRDRGWEPATILEIEPPFRLARRIDARRIEPAGPGTWRLLDAVETRYALSSEPGGAIVERRANVLIERFPETASDLALRSGRPRQLPLHTVREQADRRARLGQPVREWRLAIWERIGQPVSIVPAALAGFAVILWRARRRRRLPLAGAVALGIGLSLALWAISIVAHATSLSGGIPPSAAGALPSVVASCVAAFCLWRS
ncbi:MAG: LptF/LptG family permease [Myxococcales bacterium]